MKYTITPSGCDVFYEFSGECFFAGIVQEMNGVYAYTDYLLHLDQVILYSNSLSSLQDAISDFYSIRDTIHAIEENGFKSGSLSICG